MIDQKIIHGMNQALGISQLFCIGTRSSLSFATDPLQFSSHAIDLCTLSSCHVFRAHKPVLHIKYSMYNESYIIYKRLLSDTNKAICVTSTICISGFIATHSFAWQFNLHTHDHSGPLIKATLNHEQETLCPHIFVMALSEKIVKLSRVQLKKCKKCITWP